MANHTIGAERRGYRGGRKPGALGRSDDGSPGKKYAKGEVWHLQLRSLPDALYAKAVILGWGNASRGVRVALQRAVLTGDYAQAPTTRIAAENWVALRKIRYIAGTDLDSVDDFEDASTLPAFQESDDDE